MNNAYILVVEDESIVAKDIQSQLRNLGYLIPFLPTSGEGAISIATKSCPDLVVMDIHLIGDIDGIQAAQEICIVCEKCPIIYLTAYADHRTMERALATSPKGYIFKPFVKKKFGEIIESALSKEL